MAFQHATLYIRVETISALKMAAACWLPAIKNTVVLNCPVKPREFVKRKFSWSVKVLDITYFTNFKEYSEALNFERERHFSHIYEELLCNK